MKDTATKEEYLRGEERFFWKKIRRRRGSNCETLNRRSIGD